MSKEESADFVSKKVSYMVQALQNALPDICMQGFGAFETDTQRFAFMWRNPPTHDVIVLEPEYAVKSAEKAQKHREKGNEYFQKKSYLTALGEYNVSVVSAPSQCTEVAAPPSENVSPAQNGTSTTDGSQTRQNDTIASDGAASQESTQQKDSKTGADSASEETKKPSDKNELALAYANRSAALFHLKYYRDCLRDIDLAFESGYPMQMQYKLYERRANCYLVMRKVDEAKASFQQALDSLSTAQLSAKAENTLRSSLTKQLNDCSKNENVLEYKAKEDEVGKVVVPSVTGGVNELHPSASAAVKVRYDPLLGRHITADQDIKVGDVLVSENPFTTVMLPGDYAVNHCYRCFAKVFAPVPCTQCSAVIFCSRECREFAWKTYHSAECKYGELLAPSLAGKIGHLAIRLVMMQGVDALLSYLKSEAATNPVEGEKAGFDVSGIYRADTYHSVYNLVTNVKHRKKEDLFEFTVLACVLMKIMVASGYLSQQGSEDLDLEMVGGAVLRHLQIIQCNGNRIFELSRPEKFDEPNPVDVGVVLYPTAALFNHSCDPNADVSFYGDKIVVRAVKNIVQGENICISYGPIFYVTKARMRHELLKGAYYFTCRCEACRENWPIAAEMLDDVPRYRCENCRSPLATEDKFERKFFTCCICKHKQDMEEVVGQLQQSYDVFAQAMNTAMNGRSADALPNFVQHLVLLQRYIRHPWRDLASCQTCVKHCYRFMANVRR